MTVLFKGLGSQSERGFWHVFRVSGIAVFVMGTSLGRGFCLFLFFTETGNRMSRAASEL